MNLSEALDAALPEIRRSQQGGERVPRIDPDLLMREDVIDGNPVNVVYQRSTGNVIRFPPDQWQFAQAFQGQDTFEEVAETFTGRSGIGATSEDAKEFAANLSDCNFWFKTSEEKNLAMSEKLVAQRGRKSKGGSPINIAHITFSAWDPDRYLSLLDRRIGKYLYSSWFTWFAILLFCFEAVIFTTKWSVLGPDIPLYYNFSKKGVGDLAEFWLLFLTLGFFHESAHGLTCKHFGGEVHSMGLMLIYLTPAFYVDVTEVWISANRAQRLATIIAGIWVEMMICGIAMIVWTNTHPGDTLHDFAYKLILITGLAVIVVNLNPLIKLDGYYFFAEWLRIPDLKERSTEFLSGLFQHHVLRLPIEVPIVPQRRIPLFVGYAAISGAYSYMMLYFVVRFIYNVFSHWFDALAIIPAGFFAFLMFRGRIRILGATLMKFFRTRASEGALKLTASKAIVLFLVAVLVFSPLWRDREDAYYLIEPAEQTVLRATVSGRVANVTVNEGDRVTAGQVLATIDSPEAASHSAASEAKALLARQQVYAAEVSRTGLGAALAAQHAARQLGQTANRERTTSNIVAPYDGVVLSPDAGNLAGRSVGTGDALLEIQQSKALGVRVFLPASEMDHIRTGDEVSLQPPGNFRPFHLPLGSIDASSVVLPQGIISSTHYKGIELPSFYAARMPLGTTDGTLRPGMTGRAKVFDSRRSIAARCFESARGFLRSLFW